jgi:predicted DNA-binding protein YlxM (UPF0122 family)
MFEKNMRIAYLLDFYEDLLDPHIRTVMRAYYDDDLSLSEIASGEGISRQGIRHLIKKGEDNLEFFESNLALAKRHEELLKVCDSLSTIYAKLEADEAYVDDATEIKRIIEVIMKGSQDVPKFNR